MKKLVFALFSQTDWPDRIALLGLVLLCAAIYLVAGWAGVLGFAGAVCIILGAFLAGTKKPMRNAGDQ